jgi:WD40 repeat protein
MWKLEGHLGWIEFIAFSPDGAHLVSVSGDGTVQLWNPATGARERRLLQALEAHSGSVVCVAFSPNGRLLASISGDNVVWVWDLVQGLLSLGIMWYGCGI